MSFDSIVDDKQPQKILKTRKELKKILQAILYINKYEFDRQNILKLQDASHKLKLSSVWIFTFLLLGETNTLKCGDLCTYTFILSYDFAVLIMQFLT